MLVITSPLCFANIIYNYNDEVMGYKMGTACSMYGEEAEFIQGFGKKARRKETTRKI
jgi:hypothetical protein